MTFKSLFGQFIKLSLSFITFRVTRFPVSHLTYETVKLGLQNTLNMSKTTRVYFGVLQSALPEEPKQKQSPAKPGGTDHTWPMEGRATKQHSGDMSGTRNHVTLSKKLESSHGSRGSKASSKTSSV